MIRSGGLAASIAFAATLTLGIQPSAQTPQQPVFRSNANVVTVPVSVRSKGNPVNGLTPADFAVFDNDVAQTVEIVSAESVAADITLVVETSKAMSDYVGSIDGQVKKIAGMIRPSDRFEVIGVSTYVETLLPMRPMSEQTSMPALKAGGLSSINDALVAALLREPDQERPHLVIALTDSIDTMSATSMATVISAAKYSSSILAIAWITMDLIPQGPLNPPLTSTSAERVNTHARVSARLADVSFARTEPATRPWLAHYEPRLGRTILAFDPLKDAARLTGGDLYFPGIFTNRTASAIFDKLYSDYRQRYLLRYTTPGVTTGGWHEIRVSIPSLPKAEISAKRGYFVEKK